mgnify:CR=1 FL=1
MTADQHARMSKAVKDGLLTQKQHDALPIALLEGIVKSKMKKGKGKASKPAPKGRKKRVSTTYPKNKKGDKSKK